eukprot:TRINITY_DN1391_c0_g1::TRINITY_DN1391_c0_g1_i1::g.20108::m.20108 TRINITY_DN1391_c0_g1::TRINITY_DN1391_c0_g1_i1::g.20108  ORF type:complete len:287 (+),score=36.63,DUF218/PF02698.12/3.2e-25,DMRL_synthase/PF00885.14/2.7,DMRL_synthase/PF00885.14/73,Prok-E2_E/PF14462.1/0.2 TRINITY_DN1391_c0_g1_i1:54-914(+)
MKHQASHSFVSAKKRKYICRRLILTVLVGFIALYYLITQQYDPNTLQDEGPFPLPEQVDAVIVLGCQIDGNTLEPSPMLRERLEAAAALLRKNITSHLVLTGGKDGPDLPSEAEVMHNWLAVNYPDITFVEAGIPERYMYPWETSDRFNKTKIVVQVHLEEESTSTRLNAVYSAPILQRLDAQRVVIVTSTFHQFRSRRTFQVAFDEVSYSPVLYIAEIDDYSVNNADMIREYKAIVYYTLRGWIFIDPHLSTLVSQVFHDLIAPTYFIFSNSADNIMRILSILQS